MSRNDTRYIVYDTESVVDGDLLNRVLYPGDELSAEEAIARYEKGVEMVGYLGKRLSTLEERIELLRAENAPDGQEEE